MSLPLCDYIEPDQIAERLGVLRDKAERITRYAESCEAGRPDVRLLDEKQQAILAAKGYQSGWLFPRRVFRTLRRTIDVLEQRRSELQRSGGQVPA